MAHTGWGRSLRLLVEGGFLEGDAALAGLLSVEPASRSNQIGMLCVDGEPVMFLKHHEISVDDSDPFLAEVGAYRWLARDKSTRALAPRLVTVEDRVVVVEALRGFQPLSEALMGSNEQTIRLMEALGRQLAVLHGARPDNDTLCMRHPWVLGVADGKVPEMLAPDPEIGPLVADIEADDSLRTATEELRGAWRAISPIHGDIKFDNIFVRFCKSDAIPNLVLLDWELAGLGLPAWDLAGVLEGLIVPGLHIFDVETALGEVNKGAPMMETYRSLVGPSLAPDNRSLIIATIVRLVQATIQLHAMRHLDPECTKASRRVLDVARTLAKQVTDGTSGQAWIL